jgi:ParB-like chromosome segregation protein Spo0J
MVTAKREHIDAYEIEKLKPWERNPKVHTNDQLNHLAASIKQFGFVDPLIIDTEGLIIGGHGRYLAAKALGLTHLPVVMLHDLTEVEKKALNVVLNSITLETTFDADMLDGILTELDEEISLADFGIELEPDADETPKEKELFATNDLEKLLIINCTDERQQQSLFAELSERGIKCKIIG